MWGEAFNKQTIEQKHERIKKLNDALRYVALFPPDGDSFFHWTKNRDVLANKSFIIYYTRSDDPYLKSQADKLGVKIKKEASAYIVLAGDKTTGPEIILCIFEDRLFFDDNGLKRPDGSTRLIMALAHEIYGHVTKYLEMDFYSPLIILPSHNELEIIACTASITFMNRVLDSLKCPEGILYSINNKQKFIDDLMTSLEEEKYMLDYYNEFKSRYIHRLKK